MLYIGIDLGTSACKFLLVDGDGRVQNTVTKEYPLAFPHPGWSEQDPAHWWQACLTGVPELLAGFDAAQVAGIGVGGQMHGLVALDGHDAVLRPAILWNDGRTAEEVAFLNGTIGQEKLSAWTGNIAFAGFTAPKLLWMRSHEPELFARIAKVMLPKDYLVYQLTGVHATDYSDASGMLLLDVAHKRWSGEMLALCGLSEAQMPKLFESFAPVGTLTADTAGWACRKALRSAPARATTPPRPSAPAPWARGGATSRWAPRARCSSRPIPSALTRTTRCTPLRTPTAAST